VLRSPSTIARRTLFPLFVLTLAACGSDATGVEEEFAASGGLVTEASGPAPTNATSASNCNGVVGAISVEKVSVPRNATCTLNGTRVRGDVKVARGARLYANGARIDGNIQAEDALVVNTADNTFVDGDVQVKRRASVSILNTIIDGNLQIEEGGTSLLAADSRVNGDLQVKKANSAGIARVFVRGNIQLEENRGALASERADVRGDFQVFKNSGGVVLTANTIAQSLQCKENSPAPTGSGNVAGEKEEQCRGL
jgi:hypothetical protein